MNYFKYGDKDKKITLKKHNHITHGVQYEQPNEAHVQHNKSAIKRTTYKVCGSLQCTQHLQTLIQVNSITQRSIPLCITSM